MTNSSDRASAHLLVGMVAISAAIGIWLTGVGAVNREQGLVEALSALTLLATFVLFLRSRPTWSPTAFASGVLFLGFLLARELDLDKLTFQHGLFSLKQYSGTAPLPQKVIALVLALTILAGVLRTFIYGMRPWLAGLVRMKGWSWFIFLALALIVAGKSLDGAARKMAGLGRELSLSQVDLALMLEETLELAAALCLMLAVVRLIPEPHAQQDPVNGRTSPD